MRIDLVTILENVKRFVTEQVQTKLTGQPKFVVDRYPRPHVLKNRYNALVLTLKGRATDGMDWKDFFQHPKDSYFRATNTRNYGTRKGMEDRLQVRRKIAMQKQRRNDQHTPLHRITTAESNTRSFSMCDEWSLW